MATQFETEGSVTATNRTAQWRSKVVEPLYESKADHDVMFEFAKKFGFYDEYTRAMKLGVKDRELRRKSKRISLARRCRLRNSPAS